MVTIPLKCEYFSLLDVCIHVRTHVLHVCDLYIDSHGYTFYKMIELREIETTL